MTTLVMIDGAIVSGERATISVFDRGFLYGDSVFETIRTYGGKPFALGEHLARLELSAGRVFIELPVSGSVLRREIEAAIASAQNEESYIRVMVTRGSGPLGLDFDQVKNPVRVVIVGPLVPPPPEAYRLGIGAVGYRTRRAAEDTDAVGAKVGNYLVAVLAMREARQAGAAEAFIVDGAGNVVEGATSNVFVVEGRSLVTPPEDAGILAGITRRHVLEVAAELGLAVRLEALPFERVLGADEVFISSSIRELLPVVSVDGRPIGSGAPGAKTIALLQGFREKVKKIMSLSL